MKYNRDMSEQIGLIGNGGHADEVEATIKSVSFRAVTKEYVGGRAWVDVEKPNDEEKSTSVNIAVGSPFVRKKLHDLWTGDSYATVLSPHAVIEETSVIGVGSYIAHGAVVTTNVSVGDHVIVGVGASIHHDCIIGDYVTVCPGAHIGGGARLDSGVFVGIGASVMNGVSIADGVVIGAGAVVIADCTKENGVYVGNPARLVKTNKEWLSEI